ncbi:MAG: hypothetical protein WCA22_07755 [Candidatus Binatus sp.]
MHVFALISGVLALIAGLLCGLTFWHRARIEIGRHKLKYRNLRRITGLAAAGGTLLFAASYLPARVTVISHSAPPLKEAGWWIMFPPLVTRSGVIYMEPNVGAPLTEWRPMDLGKASTFDSESACQNARSEMESKAEGLLVGAPADLAKRPLEKTETAGKWVFALEVSQSRCIATDDPQLSSK